MELNLIYLVSNTPNSQVKNLKVCQIEFFKFNVDLGEFEALIITSKNAIKAILNNKIKLNLDLDVFAIGEASAKACKEAGFKNIYIAKNSHGIEFAQEILPLLKDKKTLFIKAKETVSDIAGKLNDINLTSIIGYENRYLNLEPNLAPPPHSTLIFTSPSNVKGFIKNFGWDKSYKAVSIGNATYEALKPYSNSKKSKKQDINECIKLALSIV